MLKRYSAVHSQLDSGGDAPAKKGLAVILIHGWGLNSLLWQKIIPRLARYRDVYTYDLPGYGLPGCGLPSGDLPGHCDDLSDDLSEKPFGQDDSALNEFELAIPKNYFVVGFSLGGVVASKLELSPFNKLKGLVTVSTNAKFLVSDDWACAMPVEELASFANSLSADHGMSSGMSSEKQDVSDRVLRRFTALQCKGGLAMRDELSYLRTQQAGANKPAVNILQDGLQCLAQSDLRNVWKSLPVPSLHQYGAVDQLVPVEAATEVANTLGMPVQVFENSAHQPFLSETDSWVTSINRFASEQLAEARYA